jgi:chromosome segregation ATPase
LIESTQNLGFEVEKKKEQINSEINISQERIQNNEENFKRYEEEIENLNKKNLELEEEKKQKLDKKTNLSTNKEKFEKELQEKEAEFEKSR